MFRKFLNRDIDERLQSRLDMISGLFEEPDPAADLPLTDGESPRAPLNGAAGTPTEIHAELVGDPRSEETLSLSEGAEPLELNTPRPVAQPFEDEIALDSAAEAKAEAKIVPVAETAPAPEAVRKEPSALSKRPASPPSMTRMPKKPDALDLTGESGEDETSTGRARAALPSLVRRSGPPPRPPAGSGLMSRRRVKKDEAEPVAKREPKVAPPAPIEAEASSDGARAEIVPMPSKPVHRKQVEATRANGEPAAPKPRPVVAKVAAPAEEPKAPPPAATPPKAPAAEAPRADVVKPAEKPKADGVADGSRLSAMAESIRRSLRKDSDVPGVRAAAQLAKADRQPKLTSAPPADLVSEDPSRSSPPLLGIDALEFISAVSGDPSASTEIEDRAPVKDATPEPEAKAAPEPKLKPAAPGEASKAELPAEKPQETVAVEPEAGLEKPRRSQRLPVDGLEHLVEQRFEPGVGFTPLVPKIGAQDRFVLRTARLELARDEDGSGYLAVSYFHSEPMDLPARLRIEEAPVLLGKVVQALRGDDLPEDIVAHVCDCVGAAADSPEADLALKALELVFAAADNLITRGIQDDLAEDGTLPTPTKLMRAAFVEYNGGPRQNETYKQAFDRMNDPLPAGHLSAVKGTAEVDDRGNVIAKSGSRVGFAS